MYYYSKDIVNFALYLINKKKNKLINLELYF